MFLPSSLYRMALPLLLRWLCRCFGGCAVEAIPSALAPVPAVVHFGCAQQVGVVSTVAGVSAVASSMVQLRVL